MHHRGVFQGGFQLCRMDQPENTCIKVSKLASVGEVPRMKRRGSLYNGT